jgi:hypothetical protein
MNYQLSKKAREKIEIYRTLLKLTEQKMRGFVIGESFGDIYIIDDFVLVELNRNNIDYIYPEFIEKYGKRAIGVIFIGEKKFSSDWFSEDFIIEFKEGK